MIRLRPLPFGTLGSGHELALSLHEMAGGAGPTLGLVGGVMGDQSLGTETIRRVMGSLDRQTLHGRVLALPVANPYAFQAVSRATPMDATVLNRVFPGNPAGTFTEQLASLVWNELVMQCDALIAFHSGGSFETVDYAYVFGDLDLARALGIPLLLPGPRYPGSLAYLAQEQGIRVAVAELGGGHQSPVTYVERGVRGALNAMRHLGMLEGQPETSPIQMLAEERVILRPRHGGVLLGEYDAADLGRTVPRGALLGRIVSPYSFDELERFEAPFEESILALVRVRISPVEAGNYAYIVVDAASARVL